jgi:hypothetical protein
MVIATASVMLRTMERWVNDPCRCLLPNCPPGACECGGVGARGYVAGLFNGAPRSCLRCGRGELGGRLCGDCAALIDTQRTSPARLLCAPAYVCAVCRVRCGAGIDVGDAVFLCEACSSTDVLGAPCPTSQDVPPCSFCGEVPRRVGLVAGPTVYVCSACAARAHALRWTDRRDPPRDTSRHCSFDGKGFRELRELFVVGDVSFCDECLGLLDDIFSSVDMRSVRPGTRVGRWCELCGHGIDPAERAAQIRDGFLCASCTATELHTARLIAFAGRS